jgi:hypothetical protein
MEKAYKNCQSCGMPLKKSPGGGSNTDGSISKIYCAYCYENGHFKQADWTLEQMQGFVKDVLKKKGFPGFLATFFAKGIRKLKRWQE